MTRGDLWWLSFSWGRKGITMLPGLCPVRTLFPRFSRQNRFFRRQKNPHNQKRKFCGQKFNSHTTNNLLSFFIFKSIFSCVLWSCDVRLSSNEEAFVRALRCKPTAQGTETCVAASDEEKRQEETRLPLNLLYVRLLIRCAHAVGERITAMCGASKQIGRPIR